MRERTVVPANAVAGRRLKRRLIEDTMGADYWEARREDTGTSLGDVAVFSLCVLLGDVAENVRARGLEFLAESQIRLRFSMPNWVGARPEDRKARQRYGGSAGPPHTDACGQKDQCSRAFPGLACGAP